MSTTYETYEIKSEGISVSLLVWRRFRKPMIGMAERIFDLNQNLADKGQYLPVGAKVIIPIDPPTPVPTREVVQLWD